MKKQLPVQEKEELTVNIEDLSYEGKGVAKVDGYPLFIDNALPGEEIIVRVSKVGKSYGFANVIEILKPSQSRVEVADYRYIQTGIAPLLHLSYDYQLLFKKKQIENLLQKQNLDVPVNDTIGMENPYHYRNKAQIPVRTVDGQLATGFFKRGTHELVPIENYLIQDAEIDTEILRVRDILRKYRVKAYDEEKNAGQVRNILVRKGFSTGEIMIVLVTTDNKIKDLDAIGNEIFDSEHVVSVMQNINPDKTNSILGKTTNLLKGKEYIKDSILGNSYMISANSFYQVNPVQTEKLYSLVEKAADLNGNETVIDAYSGMGTIGSTLAKHAKKVTGIEIVKSAVKDAQMNSELNGIKNIEHIHGKAEDVMNKWAKDGRTADVLVVDPPRKGLDSKFVESALNIKPQKIVYVSCNPATLVRDLKLFKDGGYEINEITPVDMFPQTNHVESVTELNLNESAE